ncbi:LytTR family transcriptional regulator [Mobilitalea sibirica]|uniref:LytTR family transcriptional regulator n=1 Tax=Mobilitalea sibirica TaxID=1462919 RepID=A0A8J7H257_9FIRM|nr:LytTR family DNA-binding domain-containing protein [Mobilitalea sibirica]MBH1940769.1 LytTR family transcriptional regulator [Mobilitalea sibirica]
MKVRIEINENNNDEDEVIIRCSKLEERIQRVYDTVMDIAKGSRHLILNKGNVEYYLPLDSILFFETSDNCISAHTVNDVYETTYRLYELEELLPGNFMRVSKSTIINLNHIYSISRNLTASSEIQFINSHKQVFVSRHYYKSLKFRLEEKRNRI